MNISQMKPEQLYELAQKLGTTSGFIDLYLQNLPEAKNKQECFEELNEAHNEIFNEDKYSDYNSFRRALSYHRKPKK